MGEAESRAGSWRARTQGSVDMRTVLQAEQPDQGSGGSAETDTA